MMATARFAVQTVLNACETVSPQVVVEIARRELSYALSLMSRGDDADDVLVGASAEVGRDNPGFVHNSDG